MSETNITQIPRAQLHQIGNMPARAAKGDVEAFFQAHKASLEPLVQGILSPDRLLKIAQTAIRQNPKLGQCTVKSLFGAVVLCAMMGLEPNTHEQHCYLIPQIKRTPRKDERGAILKDRNGKWITDETYEVSVRMGYRGRIKLAYNSPKLRALSTHVIHANDKYRIIEGSNPRIEHEPKTDGERGEPIIYYAIARLDSGAVIFEWMSVRDINRIRDQYSDAYKFAASNNKTDTPWITHYDAMARKTVLNRFSAYLPTNRQSAIAEALDRRETTGSLIDMGAVIDSGDPDVAFIDQADEPDYPDQEQPQIEHRETVGPAPDGRQREAQQQPAQKPTPIKRPAARQPDAAPWWDGLELKGRAASIAQNAPVRTKDEARKYDWRQEPGAGPQTVEQIHAALGITAPPEKPAAAPRPLPPVSQKTAAIQTTEDDDDEDEAAPSFGFGDPE